MLEQVVAVYQIEHVRERVLRRLGHQGKLTDERILGHSMGLSDNEVVAIWEDLKGVL